MEMKMKMKMKMSIDIDSMTEKQAKELLKSIVSQLQDLDSDDFFGSEGWKRFFGIDN